MRLVSRAELARMAGVTRAAVTRIAKTRLAPAIVGRRIDIDHPAVLEWLEGLAPSDQEPEDRREAGDLPDAGQTSTPKNGKNGAANPTAAGPGEEDIAAYLDLTLRELTSRFGTVRAFSDWLDCVRKIEQIRGTRLDNEEAEERLVARDLVRRGVFGILEGLCRRLLGDIPKTIVRRVYADAKAGKPAVAAEKTVADLIGAVVEDAKTKTLEALD